MPLAERVRRVLDDARYLSLATVSDDGRPWVAVLQYAWLPDPLRLLFTSAIGSRHSRDVADRPDVGAALFATGGGGLTDVDGAQLVGSCRELTAARTREHHDAFEAALMPDPAVRAEYGTPVEKMTAPAPHRIYQITVDRLWLIDTSTWAEDRIDRRVEVPRADLP